jgi:hypothetical protein
VTEGYADEDEARIESMIDDLARAGALPEPPIEGRRMARLALEQIRHSHFLDAAFRHEMIATNTKAAELTDDGPSLP